MKDPLLLPPLSCCRCRGYPHSSFIRDSGSRRGESPLQLSLSRMKISRTNARYSILSTTTCSCGHIRTTTRVELINLNTSSACRQWSRTTPIWLLSSGNLFFKKKGSPVLSRGASLKQLPWLLSGNLFFRKHHIAETFTRAAGGKSISDGAP